MKPLIKWPGGKFKEFKHLKPFIPNYSRYIEPFFGGGGVFFRIKPQAAIINDSCTELMKFYQFISNDKYRSEFKRFLYDYVKYWESISEFVKFFEKDIQNLYDKYKLDQIKETALLYEVEALFANRKRLLEKYFKQPFFAPSDNLEKQFSKNLNSKLRRIKSLEEKKGELSTTDFEKNIETAFRSGFYMHFRELMNNPEEISEIRKIANYYFVREFCYGSMFRFNRKGEFNIPYGGISYNTKDFRSKVDYLFSPEVKNLFKNITFLNNDFEYIFKNYKLSKKDFLFLDPPYDTNFSDYEGNTFDREDQKRLANCLYQTSSKFLLVIKNTEFIHNLYSDKKGIKIEAFDKKYSYNVRGRNERDVEHLVIYNY